MDRLQDGVRLLSSERNSNLSSSLGDEIHTNHVAIHSSMMIGNSRPVMLLMKRSKGAKHTRNSEDLVRQWSESFTDRLVGALRSQFPEYNLRVYSDKDEKLMTSHGSQIRLFAGADVLIGMHGAGLSNQVYMKPNSAVVGERADACLFIFVICLFALSLVLTLTLTLSLSLSLCFSHCFSLALTLTLIYCRFSNLTLPYIPILYDS